MENIKRNMVFLGDRREAYLSVNTEKWVSVCIGRVRSPAVFGWNGEGSSGVGLKRQWGTKWCWVGRGRSHRLVEGKESQIGRR